MANKINLTMVKLSSFVLLAMSVASFYYSCIADNGSKVVFFDKYSNDDKIESADFLSITQKRQSDSTEVWDIKYSDDSVLSIVLSYSHLGISLLRGDTQQLVLPFVDTFIDSDCKMIYPFVFDEIFFRSKKVFTKDSLEVFKIGGVANSHYGHRVYYTRSHGPIAVMLNNDDGYLKARLSPHNAVNDKINSMIDSLVADTTFFIRYRDLTLRIYN